MTASLGINEYINFPGDELNDGTLFGDDEYFLEAEFLGDSLNYLSGSYVVGSNASTSNINININTSGRSNAKNPGNLYHAKFNRSFNSDISTETSFFEDVLLGSSVSDESNLAILSPACVSMEEIDALFKNEKLAPLVEDQVTSTFPSILESDTSMLQNYSIEEMTIQATGTQDDNHTVSYNFDLDLDIQELQDQDCVGELSELPQEIVVAVSKIQTPRHDIVIETPAAKTPKTIKRAKRPKPQFTISASLFHRINGYWSIVSQNEKYLKTLSAAIRRCASTTITPLQAEQFINNVVPALLPNYVSLSFFKDVQGKDGWYYEKNKKRQAGSLALRWCGQELNFYDPFIIRYQLDESGKPTYKQALCPYCPVDKDLDLDNIFHTTQDSLYMHHVCKDHGVYSTGYEMSPPLLAFENDTPVAFCTECGETCKIVGLGSGVDNCMISYFRHAFISHNKKKQKRTREQKQSDHVFFNGARKRHIYENFKASVTSFRPISERATTTESEDLLEEKYLDDVIMEDSNMEIDEFSDLDANVQHFEQNSLFVIE